MSVGNEMRFTVEVAVSENEYGCPRMSSSRKFVLPAVTEIVVGQATGRDAG
jgi:hypothetical protein